MNAYPLAKVELEWNTSFSRAVKFRAHGHRAVPHTLRKRSNVVNRHLSTDRWRGVPSSLPLNLLENGFVPRWTHVDVSFAF
jgi:hypothetical protein